MFTEDFFDAVIGTFIFLILLGSILILFVGLPSAAIQYEGLFQECLKDGHKAYECQGILRGRY